MGDRNSLLRTDAAESVNLGEVETHMTDSAVKTVGRQLHRIRIRDDDGNICVRSQSKDKERHSCVDGPGPPAAMPTLTEAGMYDATETDVDGQRLSPLPYGNRTQAEPLEETAQRFVQMADHMQGLEMKLRLAEERQRIREQEMNQKDDHIQRLTGHIRRAEGDIKDLTMQLEISENKCSGLMKVMQEQEQDFYASQHEVKGLKKAEEQLKSNLVRIKNTHSMEISHFNQEIDDLRDEVDRVQQELIAAKAQTAAQTDRLANITQELEIKKKSCWETVDEINRRGSEIERQDQELRDLRSQMSISQQELEISESRITQLHSEVDVYRKKSESAVADISKLESALAKASDQLSSMHKQNLEKDGLTMQMKCELEEAHLKISTVENDLFLAKSTISRLEKESTERLNDLKKTLDQLSKNNSTILNLNEQLVLLRNENFQKDDTLQRTKLEFISYKEKHSQDNGKFFEKQNLIQQMELEANQMDEELQLKLHQLSDLSESAKELREQLCQAEEQIKDLQVQRSELERTNKELIADREASHQKFSSERSNLRHQIKQAAVDLSEAKHHVGVLENEITKQDDRLSYLAAELKTLRNEIAIKTEENEELLKSRDEALANFSDACIGRRIAENHAAELERVHEQWRDELNQVISKCNDAVQERAQLEEKLSFVEQNRTSLQEKLAVKETDFAKLENSHRKILAELADLKELGSNQEEEIREQDEKFEKLHQELLAEKENAHSAVQEMVLYKQKASTLEYALESEKDSQKQLNDKLLQQGHLLNQLKQDFDSKCNQLQDLIRQLQTSKQMVAELQDEIDLHQKRERSNSNRLRDQELALNHMNSERENLQLRLHNLQEQSALRDSEMQVTRSNLDTSQKQVHHQQQEITRYEESIAHLKTELEKSQSLYSNTGSKLLECQDKVHECTAQLSTLKGKHQEVSGELADKSRQLIMMKSQLNHSKQQTEMMRAEITMYENKTEHFKSELTKLQEGSKCTENKWHRSDKMCQELRNEIAVLTSRNQHNLREISVKDEEQVLLRIELSSLQEKLKKQSDENCKSRNEIDSLQCKLKFLSEEKQSMSKDLEESKVKNDLLFREGELVTQSVSQILERQKYSNEILSHKVQEQNEAIVQLVLEKDHLQDQLLQIQKERNRLEMEMDKKHVDHNAFKALQNHSAQQLMVIHHLRKRLDEQIEELEQKSKTKFNLAIS